MSKREAFGDHTRREDMGAGMGMASTPDDKPQRATAAQMASRSVWWWELARLGLKMRWSRGTQTFDLGRAEELLMESIVLGICHCMLS
ncbi:hypothetical protein N7470_005472 [Penicillium chermesinum]|nr:hypothetical protein N7470_005472 [Penicillium chermesinum]